MSDRVEPKDEGLASTETVATLQTAKDLKLKATQIRQLYAVARPEVFIAAAATVLVLTGVLWTVTQRGLLIAWCVAGLIMYLVRQRYVAAFDRSSPDDEAMLWWGKVCVIASWIGGIHWAVATLFLFPANSLLHQTVVAFMVSGICVGTIAAASARKEVYLPVITLVLLSQACRYFWERDYAHVAMGVMSIVLLAIFIMIANRMNEMNTESLKLRFHNEDLVHEVMEREAQYRSLVDHAPIGILFANNEGRITEWNPGLLDILGLSSEEAAKFLNLYGFPPLTKSGISAAFRRCIEENRDAKLEVAYVSEQGNSSNLSIVLTPRRDSSGSITGAQALVEDITDRKREELERRLKLEARAAEELRGKNLELSREIETRKVIEETLRVSEERFRAIFENTEDSMFIKNEELEYTHVNPAFLKLLDRDNNGVIGKTDEELSLDSDYSAHASKLEKRVLKGETLETEHTLNWKGWPITLNVVRFPLRGSEGKTFGACAIARDVSDRRNRDGGGMAMKAGDYPSVTIQRTVQQVSLAAESDSTVLFLGESGTGKDHWARVLHERSHRSGGSFLTINCAALSPELVESELFGHEAGAFTGARTRKRGLLELAEGGCLLLNEIGEMPLSMQSKLLTFLDSQTIMRLGGQVSIPVDVRILAATNRDIQTDAQQGRFRSDLFYRLDVFTITIPPLRERMEDIPALVWELLSALVDRLGLPRAPAIDSKAMDALMAYHWPGNVRELGNVLERALILSCGDAIRPAHLTLSGSDLVGRAGLDAAPPVDSLFPKDISFQDGIDEAKRMLIGRALEQSGGRIKDAAVLLGMTRNSINHHMRSLGIRRRPMDSV